MNERRDREMGMTPGRKLETWRFMRAAEQLGCIVVEPEDLKRFYTYEEVEGLAHLVLEKPHA